MLKCCRRRIDWYACRVPCLSSGSGFQYRSNSIGDRQREGIVATSRISETGSHFNANSVHVRANSTITVERHDQPTMDYTHDTRGRLSAQDAMMMESPHGTPVKKVRHDREPVSFFRRQSKAFSLRTAYELLFEARPRLLPK
jgi:hypothetical protein